MGMSRVSRIAWAGVLAGSAPIGSAAEHQCVVEPRVVVDVGSAASGVIERLDVERGQVVTAGEVLAELESGVERAALSVARARAGIETDVETRQVALDFQQRARTRVDELYRRQTVAASAMDEAERDVLLSELALRRAREERELAALELERARQVLARRTVRSPVSGVIVERFANAGEYVEDQPLVRVAELDPLRVQVVLPAERYGAFRVGTVADVMPEIAALGTHEAIVTSVDKVLDAASGTFRVELELPNPRGRLPAGMRCTLSFGDRAPSPETAAALAHARAGSAPDTVAGQASEGPGASECRRVGPFASAADADAYAARLDDALAPSTVPTSATEVVGYLVVADPARRGLSAEALAEKLAGSGLADVAPIGRGAHAGQVSLGYFRLPDTAEGRLAEVRELGFEATIAARERVRSAYWVRVSTASPPAPTGARVTECADLLASRG